MATGRNPRIRPKKKKHEADQWYLSGTNLATVNSAVVQSGVSSTSIDRQIDQGVFVNNIPTNIVKRFFSRVMKGGRAHLWSPSVNIDGEDIKRLKRKAQTVSKLYTSFPARQFNLEECFADAIHAEVDVMYSLFATMIKRICPDGKEEKSLVQVNDNEYLKMTLLHMLQDMQRLLLLAKAGRRHRCGGSELAEEVMGLTTAVEYAIEEIPTICGRLKRKPMDLDDIGLDEARQFWKLAFGTQVLVPWSVFFAEFMVRCRFSSDDVDDGPSMSEMTRFMSSDGSRDRADDAAVSLEDLFRMRLKRVIDVTKDNCVSLFEFHMFSQLFQPWIYVYHMVRAVCFMTPAFCFEANYPKARAHLQALDRPGSFIYRPNMLGIGRWIITYMDKSHKLHEEFLQVPLARALLTDLNRDADDRQFIYPYGETADVLSKGVRYERYLSMGASVVVTREMNDPYLTSGSTFIECKVCGDREKDIRLWPCMHLLCKVCLMRWKRVGNWVCPFCRFAIDTTEDIKLKLAYAGNECHYTLVSTPDSKAPVGQEDVLGDEDLAPLAEGGVDSGTCTVCRSRKHEIRLCPCSHMTCYPCLVKWAETGNVACPFCRVTIESSVEFSEKPFSCSEVCSLRRHPSPTLARPASTLEEIAAELENLSSGSDIDV